MAFKKQKKLCISPGFDYNVKKPQTKYEGEGGGAK